jgi:hypothetical protein
VKPAPLIVAELIVTAVDPLEVNVTASVTLEPNVTSPKLKLVGFTVSCCALVPVPVKLTLTVGLVDALLFNVNVPVAADAVVGANFTVSVTVCLGLSVIGKVAPDTVNALPLIAAALIVNEDVPLDVTVTGSVALDPTPTLPKLREVELIVH